MVVQHNLTAMNSNRMLGITQGTLSKSTEKLSSGYKVNRAADDAAGLAISEKMRKQIRGLTQASANAEDGISAVQTAEGALTEVHDMLQRMNELAVKAANGTNSENDRAYIQDEISQLTTEIDRVAETTKFNEAYLLKGDARATQQYSFSYMKADGKAVKAASAKTAADPATNLDVKVEFDDASVTAGSEDQNTLAKSIRDQGIRVTATWDANAGGGTGAAKYSIELNGDAAQQFKVVNTNADAGEFQILNKDNKVVAKITASGIDDEPASTQSAVITATTVSAAVLDTEVAKLYDKDGNGISANDLANYFSVDSDGNMQARADAPQVYDALGKKVNLTDYVTENKASITMSKNLTAALTLKLHVGADATTNNQISVNLEAMSAKGLGVNALKVDGSDDTNARNAIETIAAAIKKVSTQRSALGAVQNRLEHTINNLDNVVENTTSAESQIRDTDMATEMVKYANNNILSQAGQSMLAQANQSNQGVLSLLG